MLFGEQIKAIRLSRGFSQKEVAAVAGISNTTLSKFESEKQQVSDETYDRIFQALKMEKITPNDYLNPHMFTLNEQRKELLKESRELVRKGEKSEQEHAELIEEFKLKERQAKHDDYILNEKRKIQSIKESAK